jgi:phosphoenolpyruvate carboxykinase (ATP)
MYENFGLTQKNDAIFCNESDGLLIEHALKYTQAKLTPEGSLLVYSGRYTGRAAEDKYIVFNAKTEKTMDWTNNVHQLSPATFEVLKDAVKAYWNEQPRMYLSSKNVGASANYSLAVDLCTPSAHHSLFFHHLMRNDAFKEFPLGKVKIYHAPNLVLDYAKYQLRSGVVIATDIEKMEVIIIGTAYAGEIKKSVFSIMNYLLPELKILPMHAGANTSSKGDVSVFFGLSGTGKTTLSTQENRSLIGDDEHGLSSSEIFNFEGGCYAKMYKLSKESEPGIYAASNRFGAILENVVVNAHNEPDFEDKTLAENTRASYPLTFINDFVPSGLGKLPKQLFFLSADAFGVLPPASKLSKEQAMYYFLSGYTAKLAGTEVGLKEPKAAFSACFGAPFMIRPAGVYAELLGEYLAKHQIEVWLINTGWTGGKYGVGERFPLKLTRRIIDAIQSGELANAKFNKEDIFGFNIPESISGVDAKYLNPRLNWTDGDAYRETAQELSKMFHYNFAKFELNDAKNTIALGGPIYK